MTTFRHVDPRDAGFCDALLPGCGAWILEPTVFGVVAVEDVEPTGFVLVALVDDRWRPGANAPAGVPRLAEVLAMGVAPRARRRGLGRQLLGMAVDFARESGARRVEADIALDNVASQAVAAEAGFRPVGMEEATYPDGQRAVRVAMEV